MTRSNSPLAGSDLLSDLGASELQDIERACVFFTRGPEEEIVGHLEPSEDVFFILSGRVRVAVYSERGREVTFRKLGSGRQFGELAAIDGGSRSASVWAETPCRLARLSRSEFQAVLKRHACVHDRLTHQLTKLVRQLSERVFEFSTIAVHNRVQSELLRLAHQSGVRDNTALIPDPPTQEQIATQVSTHREAVSREFSLLKRRGVIERHGKALKIADVRELERLVHHAVGLPVQDEL